MTTDDEDDDTDRPVRALCRRCGGDGVELVTRMAVVGPDRQGVLHGVDGMTSRQCSHCEGDGWLTFGD